MSDVRALLGWRLDGRPIWAYLGSDNEGEGTDSESDEDDEDEDDEGDTESDEDKVKRLIEQERARARNATAALKPFTKLLRDFGVKSASDLEDLVRRSKGKESDAEEAARKERETVLAKANKRIVSAEIRAQAAGSFADPSDATRFLDLEDYEVDDDGEVDAKAISRDLKALLADKPHLAKRGKATDFEPGARGSAPKGGVRMDDVIRNAAGRRR